MDIFSDLFNGVTSLMSGLWPQLQEKPGLINGKLRSCPGTPNCVSSESCTPAEKVDPLKFIGSSADAWLRLKAVIIESGGVIEEEQQEYIWSTFTVPVFGFVDDVEFRLDRTENIIHVRSASRLGISDLGVNRSRVDQLREAFGKAGKN
ncbi:MAG: DUF1499 domain-containing protein [Chlorobiaceae bacterium]|jgi:uncharacterized protein (DUF1499 family)|nr:DUF1499 domain-containing protein [Chlorobiaceae bacterium]NTW63481.1 DUF1499 domain-containing protein [Chlorobiaceae bacterium]